MLVESGGGGRGVGEGRWEGGAGARARARAKVMVRARVRVRVRVGEGSEEGVDVEGVGLVVVPGRRHWRCWCRRKLAWLCAGEVGKGRSECSPGMGKESRRRRR